MHIEIWSGCLQLEAATAFLHHSRRDFALTTLCLYLRTMVATVQNRCSNVFAAPNCTVKLHLVSVKSNWCLSMGRQNNNKVKILAPIKTTENIWRLFPILFSFHWAILNSPIQFHFLHSHRVLYKSYRAERIWCKMYMINLLHDKFVFLFLRVKMKHSIEMIKCPTYQTNETAADKLEPDP